MTDAPALSLADLQAHDPGAHWDAPEVDCLCPLPTCSGKTRKHHRSLGVNTRSGLWVCHRCGAKGKLKDHWQDRPAGDWKQRRRAQAMERIAGPPPPAAPDAESLARRPPEATQERYARHFPESRGAEYLLSRGIPPDVAAAHGCGYAPDLYGRPRVTFPYRDRAGALVAISGRAVVDCPPGERQRHMGPLGQGVFNPAALATPDCIITEAPIDALSLAVCGYAAVALGGTSAPDWIATARMGGRTWVGTDADPPAPDGTPGAGDVAAARLDATLRYTRALRLRPPDPCKDWNAVLCTMGRDALTAWLIETMGAPAAPMPAVAAPPPPPAEPTPTEAAPAPAGAWRPGMRVTVTQPPDPRSGWIYEPWRGVIRNTTPGVLWVVRTPPLSPVFANAAYNVHPKWAAPDP